MFDIDVSLLPVKGHYFAFFASQAGILSFLMTIASQFGASPALIGVIYSTLPFFAMVAKPSFGFLADKFQQKKSIFLSCVVLMTLFYFAIYFIPTHRISKKSDNFSCHGGSLYIEMCYESTTNDNYDVFQCNATLKLSPENPFLRQICSYAFHICPSENTTEMQLISFASLINRSDAKHENGCVSYPLTSLEKTNRSMCTNFTKISCQIECSNGYKSENLKDGSAFYINTQITYLWILMIFAYMFMCTATSMGDAIVLDLIPNYGLFGRQRLFGSIGFGLFNIVTGLLVDIFSTPGENLNFTPAFVVVLVMGILDFLIISQMPDSKAERPKNLFKNVCGLFLKAEIFLFTSAVFFVGYFSGILWTFLIVYLNSLGATQLLIGLAVGVECFIGEIPFMFVSKWFLKKLGHGYSMTLVLAVFGIRFLLYYFITDPWMVLPIEVTNGICYGIFFTALATYSSIIAPPSAQATMQGILQGVFEGLGAGTGCLLTGLFYQALGAKMMWLIMGLLSCALSILHGFILFVITRKSDLPKEITNGVNHDVDHGVDAQKEVETSKMLPGSINPENM